MYLELYASALIDLGFNVYFYADLEKSFEEYLALILPELRSVENIAPNKKLKRWSIKWIMVVAYNISKRYIFLTFLKFSKLFSILFPFKRFNNSFVSFSVLSRKLKVLKECDFKPDLVICMYLDLTYLGKQPRKVFQKLSIPWIGLLFHPPAISSKKEFAKKFWFSDKSNKGSIFFTDAQLEAYRENARYDQTFATFPDVTRQHGGKVPEIKPSFGNFVGSRKVIGLIGALDGTKKLIKEFLALAKDPRLEKFLFVMVGEVYESTLDVETLEEVRNLSGKITNNLYVVDEYIKSEIEFEGLLQSTDVLFAYYRNFDSSANVLAKAAFFRKPVLVKANTWMGRLTENYNLGLSVSNSDHDLLVDAILTLGNLCDDDQAEFGFEKYLDQVSVSNLRFQLDNYLTEVFRKA
jgi:glycosyltransferase involved in cell wall biosynthesis